MLKRRIGLRRGLGWMLAIAGLVCVGDGLWIHAKARLGQALIERAWEQQKGGNEMAKPWPWADTRPVARLQVPVHGIDVFVLAGGTGRTLAWGPGHLAGTARVGGPGNAVIGGHRDTHFAFLRELEVGTEITTENGLGERRIYRVREAFVTHERDAAVLAPSEESRLTLVTCWPFDAPLPGGRERYVVVADEVAENTGAVGHTAGQPGQPEAARARPDAATAFRLNSRKFRNGSAGDRWHSESAHSFTSRNAVGAAGRPWRKAK